jgi:hypothetical protein
MERGADALGPASELVVRVLGLPQPQEPEGLPREVVGPWVLLVRLGHAPRHALLEEQLARLAPGRVPELHRRSRSGWEVADEGLDQPSVVRQRGRALVQHRAEPLAERARHAEEVPYVLVGVIVA